MSRQNMLFLDLEAEHRFNVRFCEIFGLELASFLELSLALISRFLTPDAISVDDAFFRHLAQSYPDGTINRFLGILSRDLTELGDELRAIPQRMLLDQVTEPTPLIRFPLLRKGGRYYCYSVHLLFRTVQNFVYDALRRDNPNDFTNRFGPVFERYLEYGLTYANLNYITEEQLVTRLPPQSKVVDFMVYAGDSIVLMDANPDFSPPL